MPYINDPKLSIKWFITATAAPLLKDMPTNMRNFNVCEIPILSDMQFAVNFFIYVSAYFNDRFLKMKSHQRVRQWRMNDYKRDEMIIFRHKNGIGSLFETGLLFDTFFRAYNDAMFFSVRDIEMYVRSMIK